MPIVKHPDADLRRRYPLYAEVGLALALGATILAFTLPTPPSEAAQIIEDPLPPTWIDEIPQTRELAPPPLPPPTPPPPVEVADEEEVIDEILSMEDFAAESFVPTTPPSPPIPQPTAPPVVDVAPPPPPVIDDEPEEWTVVEQDPVLVGGLEGLQARVRYPEQAIRAQIEGRVVVQFVVDERGQVIDPVAVQSPSPLLSQAATEAVRASTFEPGQQRGRAVRVRFAVPVTFRLR